MNFDKNSDNFIGFNKEYFQHLFEEHIDFDEEDVWEFLDKYEVTDYREYDEPRRWSQWVTSYCNFNDKWYEISWDRGLTEMQNNSWFGDQPVEVIQHEYEKTIIMREWKYIQ